MGSEAGRGYVQSRTKKVMGKKIVEWRGTEGKDEGIDKRGRLRVKTT